MNQPHTLRLSSWARLVGLALLLGILAVAGGVGRPAYAATTLTVTNCSTDSQLQADVSTANSDNAGDTITFACNGAIPLTSTLTISGSMTLDGSGQQVTLDGQHSREVLFVNFGVSFTLKALTIANGSSSILGEGGGIENNGGTVNISNSTVSGNSAPVGGGINSGFGTLTISNSTVSGNSAAVFGGGIENGGTVNIGGSIVANNAGGNCNGGVTDQGYNLESSTDCGFTGTGSLQNTDPKLASALASNGGPTQTLALLDGSPAIDHIPAANCPATDQRGVTRLPGERCDIGAFEFPDTTAPTLNLPSPITVNATSPQGAVVSYTATATDGDGDTLVATCAPASGSTFPIGTTTVNCSASEPGSDTASGSFQVVVKGAAAQVTDLISLVNSFHLSKGLQDSLDVKLNAALKAVNAGQTATACSDLSDFIGQAQSQSGKGLTVSQANQLIAAAKQVQAVLGC